MIPVPIPKEKLTYPRVTSILSATMRQSKKDSITYWKKQVGNNEADRVLEEAINRGNHFHDGIDHYFNRYNPDAIPKGVLEFFAENEIVVLMCEVSVWSDEYGYRGRTDIVYLRAGKYYGVLDWKTGKKERPASWFADAKAQVSAYAQAIKEKYGLPITEAMVVVAYKAVDEKAFNPFALPEVFWKFQKCFISETKLKQAFNRFVKRIGEYHNPPAPKPRKAKLLVPLVAPRNPFAYFQ